MMTSSMMSFSLHASKHIFKYSLEVSWLAFKFGVKGKIMATNSCVTLKLIRKHL